MDKLKKPLFHYTSRDAFLNIIRTKKIRATNILYLNDSEEFQYIFNLASQILSEYPGISPNALSNKFAFKTKAVDVTSLFPKTFAGCIAFVFSLSEKRDLLSQWRGYSDSCGGICIGFNDEYIKKLAKKRNLTLAKCIYDKEKQVEKVKKMIESHFSNLEGEYNEDIIHKEITDYIRSLLLLAPYFKHHSFEEEEEWRLIFYHFAEKGIDEIRKVKFRNGHSMIVPYVDIELECEDVKIDLDDVIVGPSPHKELSEFSTGLFLGTQNVSYKNVKLSKIPFRSW